MILFNTAIETDSNDYMLVLDANAAARGDIWYLTVVFEDGTVDEITVDDDDLGDLDPERKADFMKAYTYSENADGTYKVGDEGKYTGTAVNLSNRTVDFESPVDTHTYISLATQGNVWDVTDVEHEGDEAVASNFSKTEVNAVLVIDNGQIRTAWIWDIPQSVTPDEPEDRELTVTIMRNAGGVFGNDVIIVDNPNNSSSTAVANAIADKLEDEGYDTFEFPNGVKENDTVKASDERLSLTFTIHYAENNVSDLEDAIAAGGQVYVGAGTYEIGQVSPAKDLVIIGNGDSVIKSSAIYGGENAGILMSGSNDLYVEGVNFTGTRGIVTDTVYAGTITVKDCTFDGLVTGIYINAAAGGTIEDCAFTDCTAGISANGLTGDLNISNSTFRGNGEDIGTTCESFVKVASDTSATVVPYP